MNPRPKNDAVMSVFRYGTIKKVCHSPEGEGVVKKMTKCDIGGRGSKPKSDVTTLQVYCFKNCI